SFIDFHLTPGGCHTGSSHVSVLGRFRDKNYRAGWRGRRTNGFERDGEGFYGLIAPGDIDMQAALARGIRLYTTDVAGRRTLRDSPDGVHFSFGCCRKIGNKDVSFARFVPEKSAGRFPCWGSALKGR